MAAVHEAVFCSLGCKNVTAMSPTGSETTTNTTGLLWWPLGRSPQSLSRVPRSLARLYGPAVRCKSDLRIWRRLVLRFCIRPLNGTFVFLAIMDIRARPISFSERP